MEYGLCSLRDLAFFFFMVASKQDLFQRERKYKAVSIDTEGGKCPEKVGRTAVYILTSIDLYTFDWFLLLTCVISNQSV